MGENYTTEFYYLSLLRRYHHLKVQLCYAFLCGHISETNFSRPKGFRENYANHGYKRSIIAFVLFLFNFSLGFDCFHYIVFYLCLLVFICVPFVFYLCSFMFHLCSTCVHLCSFVFHLCSFVFHLCSFVFICVHLCLYLCGVLD